MTTLTFDIPKSLWLSLNDRLHWREKSKRTRADLPCERCVFVPTPGGKCICEVPR